MIVFSGLRGTDSESSISTCCDKAAPPAAPPAANTALGTPRGPWGHPQEGTGVAVSTRGGPLGWYRGEVEATLILRAEGNSRHYLRNGRPREGGTVGTEKGGGNDTQVGRTELWFN